MVIVKGFLFMKVFIIMNLKEQISRIKQVMSLTEGEPDKFMIAIQRIIDGYLRKLRIESESWSLGEMDELDEIESIENIRLVDYNKNDMTFSVVIDVNSKRRDFDNTILSLEYEINKLIPNAKFDFEINDIRKFGPGIDW